MLQLNTSIKKMGKYTRVVENESGYILDSGSAPILLDETHCQNIKNEGDPMVISFGGVKIDNLKTGTNKNPLFTQDNKPYKVLCKKNLNSLIGANGVIGLNYSGDESCVFDSTNPNRYSCEAVNKMKNYSYMNQQKKYHGFTYKHPKFTCNQFLKTEKLTNIQPETNNNKTKFKKVDINKDNIFQYYPSTQRQSSNPQENTFNIFDLGWPLEFTEMMKGKPCKYGAQFLGAGDISYLSVDHKNGEITYGLFDKSALQRCD